MKTVGVYTELTVWMVVTEVEDEWEVRFVSHDFEAVNNEAEKYANTGIHKVEIREIDIHPNNGVLHSKLY